MATTFDQAERKKIAEEAKRLMGEDNANVIWRSLSKVCGALLSVQSALDASEAGAAAMSNKLQEASIHLSQASALIRGYNDAEEDECADMETFVDECEALVSNSDAGRALLDELAQAKQERDAARAELAELKGAGNG